MRSNELGIETSVKIQTVKYMATGTDGILIAKP